jgi:hypothetical protein
MITLLGTLLGLLGASLPHFMNFWKIKADNNQELALMRLQLEAIEKQGSMKIDDVFVQGSFTDMSSARELAAKEPKGYRWMEAYVASVRPTLSYFLFFLYAWAKTSGITAVWSEEDSVLVATMFSFYFGSRVFDKIRR